MLREHGRLLVEAAVLAALLLAAAGVWFAFLRERPRPNVVLISIDSLRYDHLGCYGYARPTSPQIDSVAARGARFATAHSTTSWTLPAHVSLMTGQPDQVHGVVEDRVPLGRSHVMLAEHFRRAGYRTGGFFGGPYLDPFFGFDRGFDVYRNCGAPTIYADAAGTPEQRDARLREMEWKSHREPTAARTEQEVERFLDDHAGNRPFFLFVHHWDVHYDYVAPPALVQQFAGPDAVPFDTSNFAFNARIHAGMDPGHAAFLRAGYDAEIRFVDLHIGLLMRKLESLGVADDTIVLITADHGEEFFDHGMKGHRNNLHEETLRIPLVIAGPGIEPGRVVEAGARIFDVAPTLLDLAGLPRADVAGVSLAPLLRGEDAAALADLPLIAELTVNPKVADSEDPRFGQGEDWFERHTAVGEGGLKVMRRTRHPFDQEAPSFQPEATLEERPLQLFNLRADPTEQRDLAAERPQWLKTGRSLLEWLDRTLIARDVAALRDPPEHLRNMLDEIGY